MTIAVTGATGALGTLVVDTLLARTAPDTVVALARDTTKAAALADRGATVREADYDRPATLPAALDGVDTLLLISGNVPGEGRVAQHRAVIDAAKAAGVGRIVYTGILGGPGTANPLAADHVRTEELLAQSGVPHTVLRNGWYNENYASALDAAAKTGAVLTSADGGRVASAARADYAEAAAAVLTAETPKPVYELSGDTAWTQGDLAAALAEVLGAPVAVHHTTTSGHVQALTGAGLDEGTARFVAAIDAAIAAGALATTTGELSALIGRPTTPLVDTLRALRG